MAFHEEIASFFAEYVDAFVCNDADALSQLWDAVGCSRRQPAILRWSGKRYATIA